MNSNIWILNHYATEMFENKGGRHYWFAENLIKMGYSSKVFTANTFHKISDKVIDTGDMEYIVKSVNGIPFVFVKSRPIKKNILGRLLNMLSFYKNLLFTGKRIAKEGDKPDVIIASSVHPLTMIAGIKLAKKFNIPCICEVRDLWPEAIFRFTSLKKNSMIGKILQKGEYWIYKKADAIIFTVEGYRDYLKKQKWDTSSGGSLDLSKTFYINNGLDLCSYKKLRNEYPYSFGKDDKPYKIIYTGSIGLINNLEIIIEAARILNSKNNAEDIMFYIFGDGIKRDELEQKSVNLGLKNIKFNGNVNKQFIPSILSHSKINLLVNAEKGLWEYGSSNNKLFEYLASAKPIISNIKIGYSILNKYKCGVELNENTPECLADTILTIKNLPKREYDQYCMNAKKAAEDFDFKEHTQQLLKVIDFAEKK